jgi:hypothetical protein
MEYNKVSDSEMEVVKEVVVSEPVKIVYNIDFLKEQEITILKDMNSYVEKRQTELEEVRGLILEAEKLGLKTKEEIQKEVIISEEGKLEDLIK